MPKVFEGIKVVDFTWAGVGPITTKYLGDYGATIIKVESKTKADIVRTSAPFKDKIPGVNRAGYFAQFNSNKYSMSINMNHPKGIELVKRLIAWADVLAESFAAGVMEKWGLGYEEVKKIKPDIIMYRTNMQGHTGVHSRLPGTGLSLVGLTGAAQVCGWPDRGPISPYGPYTDAIAPRFGAAVLIAALCYREETGKGQLLDMSQFEAGVNFLTPLVLDYCVNNRVASRAGNYCSYAAPHNAYRCRGQDRWCTIAVFSNEEWQSFCRVIGNPLWTRDERFATLLGRKEHELELDRLVEGWTINHTGEEVMTLMQKGGVATGIVETNEDLLQDPQLKQRHHFWILNHREMGPLSHMGQACQLSKTPAELKMAAPCLGEHNEYVCTKILGMSDEEFVELLQQGVFD